MMWQRCLTPPADMEFHMHFVRYMYRVLEFVMLRGEFEQFRAHNKITLPRTSNKRVYHLQYKTSRIMWTFCFVSNLQ